LDIVKKPNVITNNTTETALPLENCLAKTYDKQQAGRNVLNHCQIVGEVARELMTRMPEWLRKDLFPVGSELIAACHDIGKVSPTFQAKIYTHTADYQNNQKPELKGVDYKKEKNWGGHAGVSQAAADALAIGKFIPEILGQHHGYSPTVSNLATDAVFGGAAWQQRREELVTRLKGDLLKCDFPTVRSPEHARVLAGLTSVADWIGSSSLFDNPITDWQPLIKQSLDNAGFIRPEIKANLSFFDIFNFQPRDSQEKLFTQATQAGVYILEAPMGLGKTEAALYAAYKAIIFGQATGIYFALPTQLTSDKIHNRVNQFLDKILTDDSSHKKALLLHGNAWLKETELGKEGNPDSSWFDNKKRGILAPFAVGTIDQALMAVMNVKHGFVRTFGLAGKVVILDEVHSYDAYTGTILDALVKALRELHCTVIILSATLTQERRAQLLAHPHGRGENIGIEGNPNGSWETPPQVWGSQHYPLISAQPHGAALQELTVAPLDNHKVTIHCCQDDSEAIEEALIRAEQGQQVLWIENTVAEAQELFRVLNTRASSMDIDCGLLHSRFLKTDRADKESHWVELYGKDNAEVRQAKGRILVGTQVLEQSLDIDADFLVSRFAPTDMLLQRMGRLWRHENTRPVLAKCEAWLLVPELNAAIENTDLFGKSAFVYAPYVLCRSLEVWHSLQNIRLPSDIRTLIEATYCKPKNEEAGKMRRYKSELEKKCDELNQLARYGLSKAGETLPETASTRYSEQDSVQVLLLRGFRHNADKTGTEITLLNNEKIVLPRSIKTEDKSHWRELAATLLKQTVQVANYLAPQALSIKELDWLKEYIYLGEYEFKTDKSSLRVAIVNESDEIKSLVGGVALEKYKLSYNNHLGYQAEK
jgi:CRISPR-associated endonuclease/helicase Cas3